jgi:hypothetical protein
MLIDFCERNGLVITNTWFKKPKRRLYTWKAPGDKSRRQLAYIPVKQRFRNSVKDVQTLRGEDINCDHNLLVANICTRLKKIICFQKRKPRWDLEKLYAQQQKVHDSPEEKFGAIKCESGNVEVEWKDIKKYVYVLDTMSDLVGKVERRARKPWITQEMISKMDERRKRKNVNNEKGRKNYRRLRNDLKRATDKAKKEYLESIYDEIIEFQRRYDLTYMKKKELGWKENHGMQNTCIEDSQGNIIIDQKRVLKFGRIILQSSTMELIDQNT